MLWSRPTLSESCWRFTASPRPAVQSAVNSSLLRLIDVADDLLTLGGGGCDVRRLHAMPLAWGKWRFDRGIVLSIHRDGIRFRLLTRLKHRQRHVRRMRHLLRRGQHLL